MIQIIPLDYAITVSGGTGQTSANLQKAVAAYSLKILNCSIKAPNSGAQYSVLISDADGHPIYTETGITGNWPIMLKAGCRLPMTIKIDGTDGAYSVRVYSEN